MSKTYVCENAGCSLGTAGRPGGRFTGGITAEARNLLTGEPVEGMKKGVDYGDGVCPNCGHQGKEFSTDDAVKEALASAKAVYDAQVAEIKKEGVA